MKKRITKYEKRLIIDLVISRIVALEKEIEDSMKQKRLIEDMKKAHIERVEKAINIYETIKSKLQ